VKVGDPIEGFSTKLKLLVAAEAFEAGEVDRALRFAQAAVVDIEAAHHEQRATQLPRGGAALVSKGTAIVSVTIEVTVGNWDGNATLDQIKAAATSEALHKLDVALQGQRAVRVSGTPSVRCVIAEDE